MGKIFFYEKNNSVVKREKIEDTQAEQQRFETARAKAQEQLQNLYEKACREVGEAGAAI